MKAKKLIVGLTVATCLAGAVCAFSACGAKNEPEDATYTANYSVADTGKYGYIGGLSMCDTQVELDLDADSTFKLTKTMTYGFKEGDEGYSATSANMGINATATFIGTYTKVGADVTLSKAATAEYSFNWGQLSYLQYAEPVSSSETDTDSAKALSLFNHWSLNTNGNSEQKVTVNAETKTLTYVSNDVYQAPTEDSAVTYKFSASNGDPRVAGITVECYANKKVKLFRPKFHDPLTGTWELDGEDLTITINNVEYYPTDNGAGKLTFNGFKYGMGQAEVNVSFVQD